jgi:hypothetical protein
VVAFIPTADSFLTRGGYFIKTGSDMMFEVARRQKGSMRPVAAKSRDGRMQLVPAEGAPTEFREGCYYEGTGCYWFKAESLFGHIGLGTAEIESLLTLAPDELAVVLARKGQALRKGFQTYPKFDSHIPCGKGDKKLEYPNARFEQLLCDLTCDPSFKVVSLDVEPAA